MKFEMELVPQRLRDLADALEKVDLEQWYAAGFSIQTNSDLAFQELRKLVEKPFGLKYESDHDYQSVNTHGYPSYEMTIRVSCFGQHEAETETEAVK